MGTKNTQGGKNLRDAFYSFSDVSGKATQYHTSEYNHLRKPIPPQTSGIDATGGTTVSYTHLTLPTILLV